MCTPLRKARLAAGKTLADVAVAAGMSKSTLSKIETGRMRPSTKKAEALATFLGTISEIEILYPERFATATEGGEGRAA